MAIATSPMIRAVNTELAPALHCSLFQTHRKVFTVVALSMLALTGSGLVSSPIEMPIPAGLAILVLGVPHGAFDVAIWNSRNGDRSAHGLSGMLVKYVALAGGFFCLWLIAPAVALPIFIAMSIYHFSSDWDHDLDGIPRLIVAGAMISAPAALHRAEVIEIFSWLSPTETANAVALAMATAALPLLQASLVVMVLTAARRPWAAAELAAVLALAWLTPPLMFFLVYFCGLHAVRHMIETHRLLGAPAGYTFACAAFPYAPLAIAGTVGGALTFSTLPPGPALVGAIFMALGALTVPHIIVVDWYGSTD